MSFKPAKWVTPSMAVKIAHRGFPEGSEVRCIPCGVQRNCTTSEIATWMLKGMPVCKRCGHKTDLVTPRDKAR